MPTKTRKQTIRHDSNRCPPDHKHGKTLTCYSIHACMCDDCKQASRNASARHKANRRFQSRGPGRPPAGTPTSVERIARIGDTATFCRWVNGQPVMRTGTLKAATPTTVTLATTDEDIVLVRHEWMEVIE